MSSPPGAPCGEDGGPAAQEPLKEKQRRMFIYFVPSIKRAPLALSAGGTGPKTVVVEQDGAKADGAKADGAKAESSSKGKKAAANAQLWKI